MADQYQDLLGSSRPIRREPQGSSWIGFSISAFQVLFVVAVCYFVGSKAWKSFAEWQEKSYKLATRRKYGIPDDDHRPFTVAYAAVKKSQKGKAPDYGHRPMIADVAAAPSIPASLRQRVVQHNPSRGYQTYPDNVPGGFMMPTPTSSVDTVESNTLSTASTSAYPSHNHVSFADDFNDNYVNNYEAPVRPSSHPSASGRKISILKPATKRPLEDEGEDSDGEHTKKTRVEGDEFIDGDEDATWQYQASSGARGSKRALDNFERDEEDEGREKRARNVADEDDMDMDEDEIVYELETSPEVSRGTKRDRADDEGSVLDDGDADASKARRKRRNKRTSDIARITRGRKRDRDSEDEEMSAEDENTAFQRSRSPKKRGKTARRSIHGSGKDSDTSISSDVRNSRRAIGDTWKSHGVVYKIGPNGQRLRSVYMRKPGSRFTMPEDSIHPDRNANVNVFFEHWLTDEEYADAKVKGLLSWQESPGTSEPGTPQPDSAAVTPAPDPQTPVASGKALLWDTGVTRGPRDSISSISTRPGPRPLLTQEFRPSSSIASNVGLTSSRRLTSSTFGPGSSISTPSSPGLADSTNSPRRMQAVRSKWEKQDMEAKAMAKIREANRKKEDAASASTLPSITLTKPDENKPASPSLFSLPTSKPAESTTKPPASNGFSFAPAAKSPLTSSVAPSDPPTSKPLFAQPSGDAAPAASNKPPLFAAALPPAAPKPVDEPAKLGLGRPPVSAATAVPSPTFTPAVNTTPFGAPARPVSAAPAAKQPPKFSFGAPAAAKPAGEKKADGPAPVSAFAGFGKPEVSAPAPSPNTGSLFSRLGQPAASNTSSDNKSVAASNPSTFGLGQPSAQSSPTPAPAAQPAAAPAPSSGGLKFNFGTANKGPSASATPAPAPASAPTPAPSGTTQTTSFSFGAKTAPAAPTQPAPTFGTQSNGFSSASATPAPSAFGFGTSAKPPATSEAPKPSGFGTTSAFGATNTQNAFSSNSNASAPTSAFSSTTTNGSAFGASSSNNITSTSAFGGNSSTPSAFGSSATSKLAFGGSSNTGNGGGFGSAANGNGSATSSSLGGALGASSPFGGSKPAENPSTSAPKFSFNAPAAPKPAAPAGDAPPKPLFSFGTTPAANGTSPSPFGGSGTSAFGSGSGTTSNIFGAKSNGNGS